jgi:hypothetical protein
MRPALRKRHLLSHLAGVAVQFKTTVIGVAPGASRGTGMRNQRRSLATVYGLSVLVSMSPVQKSGCGIVAANAFVVSMFTAIKVPSGAKKENSRHRVILTT